MNFGGAFLVIVEAIFSLYSILVLARFMLQLGDADFYNPISQTVVKCTQVPLAAIRKLLPSYGKFDTASFVWLFIVQILYVVVKVSLSGGFGAIAANPIGVFIPAVREMASLILNFWLFGIFIQVIGSWFAMGQYNPLLSLVSQMTRPIMEPIQRIVPPLGGLDLSPMFAMLAIIVVKQLFWL